MVQDSLILTGNILIATGPSERTQVGPTRLDHYKPANQITCQIGLGGARGAVIIFIASDMTSKTLVAHQAKILNVCFKCHHILQ